MDLSVLGKAAGMFYPPPPPEKKRKIRHKIFYSSIMHSFTKVLSMKDK